jgi:hypothetical protein
MLFAIAALSACGGGGGTSSTPPVSQQPVTAPAPAPTSGTSSDAETIQTIAVTAADTTAAKSATGVIRHVLGTHLGSPSGATPQTIQYPEDLGYGGGHVLTSVSEQNVYISVNSSAPSPSTWGHPWQFLSDLGKSSFIHVTDQYTKTSGHYYPGGSLAVTDPNLGFAPLYDNDIFAVVHAAAKAIKKPGETGYERIYNLFFPPGVDICVTFSTACYSPDNLGNFVFCAYHESVTFPDVGHVLVTVNPYQAALVTVNGQQLPACSIQNPSDPSFVESSTDSNLSHEIFEAITDPDPGTGWTVPFSNGGVAGGFEIGDLCAYAPIESSNLNGTTYHIQPEYSNLVHGCVNQSSTGP